MPFDFSSTGKPDTVKADLADQLRHGKESGHEFTDDLLKAISSLEPFLPKKSAHHNGLHLEAKGHVDDYSGEIVITLRTLRLAL